MRKGLGFLVFVIQLCIYQCLDTLTVPLELQGSRLSVGEIRSRIALLKNKDALDDESLVLLQNVKSLQYIGVLYFGSAQTKSKCIYDTGSSNTWSYTSECKTVACKQHNLINISGRSAETEIEIEYGSGSITGLLLQDTISFEECKGSCESSPSCHCAPAADWIGVTKTTGEAFEYGEFNCILGLAHPKLAAENTKMSLVAMMESSRITNTKFGFYLTKKPDSSGSQFTIGDPDPRLYTGSMTYHDLYYPGQQSPSYWTVQLSRITLKYGDGRTVDTGFCKGGCEMALDSGTSLFTGPQKMIYPLIDQLDVEEDCSNSGSLPSIGFTVENPQMTYWIAPDSYVYKEKEDSADICIGSFFPLDIPSHETLWIAGDSFLSSYYSVYDFSCWKGQGTCKAGLAAKAGEKSGASAGLAGVDSAEFRTITSGDVTEIHPLFEDVPAQDPADIAKVGAEEGERPTQSNTNTEASVEPESGTKPAISETAANVISQPLTKAPIPDPMDTSVSKSEAGEGNATEVDEPKKESTPLASTSQTTVDGIAPQAKNAETKATKKETDLIPDLTQPEVKAEASTKAPTNAPSAGFEGESVKMESNTSSNGKDSTNESVKKAVSGAGTNTATDFEFGFGTEPIETTRGPIGIAKSESQGVLLDLGSDVLLG